MAERPGFDDRIEAVLERLAPGATEVTVAIDDRRVRLDRLDRALWPGRNVTKREYLRYLASISPAFLHYLRDRPVALAGAPEATALAVSECWPGWVRTMQIPDPGQAAAGHHVLVPDLATLLWVANAGLVEWHVCPARIDPAARRGEAIGFDSELVAGVEAAALGYPDFLIVSLDWERTSHRDATHDAYIDRLAFRRLVDVALDLRSVARTLGTDAFVKTSGRRGLDCLLPLDQRRTANEVRSMAVMIGQFLIAVRPRNSTRTATLLAQSGVVSVDSFHNGLGRWIVAPYSLRAGTTATVSAPVNWNDLPAVYPSQFTIDSVPDHIAAGGDPWAELRLPRWKELPARIGLPHDEAPGGLLAARLAPRLHAG